MAVLLPLDSLPLWCYGLKPRWPGDFVILGCRTRCSQYSRLGIFQEIFSGFFEVLSTGNLKFSKGPLVFSAL